MPFQRIAGTFHVTNYSPDGDTIRFAPADPDRLAALDGPPAKINGRGHVSLRLEGIDALETHYSGQKQPAAFADGATDALLAHLGIGNIVWADERRSVVSADDGVAGHILARGCDKYGRVIALAFPGAGDGDGEVFVEADHLDGSANRMLLREGLAYPTFYWSLFADLRDALAAASGDARDAGRGLHAEDRTTAGFEVLSLASITDDHVILPKLFRRLVTYLESAGSVEGFKAALEASAEPVFDLRDRNFTHFDTFIEQDGATIRLHRDPEELVFDPMPARVGTDFDALVEAAAAPFADLASAPPEDRTFPARVAALKSVMRRG